MSEQTTTTPVAGSESPADGLSGPPEGGDTGEGASSVPDGPQNVNKEAQYRVQRNEARAERDALAERIAAYQRREVERLASEHLSMPGDIFSLSGNELADYLTEDGDVDAEKVAADAAAVLAERPGLRKPAPAFDPTQGRGGSTPTKAAPSWGDLLKS